MQGPPCSVGETWEHKAKPLERVDSYILQLRSSGINERTSPEKLGRLGKEKERLLKNINKNPIKKHQNILHKIKNYHTITLVIVSGNLTKMSQFWSSSAMLKVSPEIYDTAVEERLCKIDSECKNVIKIAKGFTGNLSRASGFKLSPKIQVLEKGSAEVQCFWKHFLLRTGHRLMSIKL